MKKENLTSEQIKILSEAEIKCGTNGEIFICHQDGRLGKIEQSLDKLTEMFTDGSKQLGQIIEGLKYRGEINGKQDKALDKDAADIDQLQERVTRLESSKADKDDITDVLTAISSLETKVDGLCEDTKIENKEASADRRDMKKRKWSRNDGILVLILGIVLTQAIVFFIKTFKWGY